MSIFHNLTYAIKDTCFIWAQEMRHVIRDEGVLIFFFIVPLAYPLLYSWIYNNETVREVPVVVVDDSKTQLSRQFVRNCDASPDVRIFCHAADLDEAKSLVSRQLVKGIYYIPSDFEERLNRMEQTTISVYVDMSLMLTYKAIYQTAMAVASQIIPSRYTGTSFSIPWLMYSSSTIIISCALPTAKTGMSTFPPRFNVEYMVFISSFSAEFLVGVTSS